MMLEQVFSPERDTPDAWDSSSCVMHGELIGVHMHGGSVHAVSDQMMNTQLMFFCQFNIMYSSRFRSGGQCLNYHPRSYLSFVSEDDTTGVNNLIIADSYQ
jgi:hypothetical protein